MPRSLDARHERFDLNAPFRISRGVKTAIDVVTVTITEGSHAGHGEGVPYPRYGESVEASLEQVHAVRSAIEGGADRLQLLELMPAGAARNAVDCALWDLQARRSGISVAEATGLTQRRPIATAMTVSLDTAPNMARAAAHLKDVPLLKVKVDERDPLTQIRAVRSEAPKPRLIVDPNESWTLDLVERLQTDLATLGVDLLEQPLPANADEGLAGLRSAVPIAADESAHVAGDVERLANRYQFVNLKLDKTGGLTAALAFADAAEAAGLGLMTGCMVSTSLSIAPALLLAQRCTFADLDGPVWLKRDRPGGIREENGRLHAPERGFWGDL
ncbi:N-acetyl-D-Glu racemase DgcA [Pacificimonas flava]|uniref:Dipeptide epimerase n=1 Tax=Pacificimonas flava TaxID=1234595 RepID=M2U459_9SPHN|nr:N-acetyl-D-Glu racemase DgcA [Pacificimonas flava]EMD82812.1 Muconate cycloisomerase [Pacificimonas flava]MBB5279428.1 L-alanine-DL-glutamate epimerase-like enolase superfamily enzyme [Pacificimonas flava]